MWRHKLTALISFGAVWHVVQLLKPYSPVLGPGTSLAMHGVEGTFGAITSGQTLNITNILRFFCWDPAMTVANVGTLFREHLVVLLGAARIPLVDLAIDSQLGQGAAGLWDVGVASPHPATSATVRAASATTEMRCGVPSC